MAIARSTTSGFSVVLQPVATLGRASVEWGAAVSEVGGELLGRWPIVWRQSADSEPTLRYAAHQQDGLSVGCLPCDPTGECCACRRRAYRRRSSAHGRHADWRCML